MENKQILTIATDVGYMLLRYGAEVYRTEQSIKLICQSYGIERVEVFAIPTSIVATVSFGDDYITKTKRLTETEIDLDKFQKLNELSRYICNNQPTYQEVLEKLQEIEQVKPHSKLNIIIAYALVGLSFTILFGGTSLEGAISFLIGIVSAVFVLLIQKYNLNTFLKITFGSFLVSVLSIIAEKIGGDIVNTTMLISGSLMIFVPGLAITNCMRDFMANDYVSGLTKFTEAVMTALATALGVSIVLLSVYY